MIGWLFGQIDHLLVEPRPKNSCAPLCCDKAPLLQKGTFSKRISEQKFSVYTLLKLVPIETVSGQIIAEIDGH
jgi:hypothetical protein